MYFFFWEKNSLRSDTFSRQKKHLTLRPPTSGGIFSPGPGASIDFVDFVAKTQDKVSPPSTINVCPRI